MASLAARRALAAGAAALAVLGAALPAIAQEADSGGDSATVNPTDQPIEQADPLPPPPASWQAATSPQLACGVRQLPLKVGGAVVATFTCWIAGAPAGDTAFSVQALRIVDELGNFRPIAMICGDGQIIDNAGACSGTVTDPTGGPLMGGLLIGATLQPSGTHIGPIHISPTLAGG